jgi:uncharacterized protein YkwD
MPLRDIGTLGLVGFSVAILLTAFSAAAQLSDTWELGSAPRVTGIEASAVPRQEALDAAPAVDRTNRSAVVNFYRTVYVPALAVTNDWNGSVAGCNAGSTGPAYIDATMDMVNYYRSMAGLPAVPHSAAKDDKAQKAALMMTANNAMSHAPPSTWTCYTSDGAEAAGKSNLVLGAAGAHGVTLYIKDAGANNTAVGHRRWILYPRQTEMGTGSTNNANALWVVGAFGTRSMTTPIVAWPPDGYVPYQLVYPRWSFSANTNSTVSFTGATVTMARNGSPVSLTVLADAVGYGDNTIAWEPSGLTFAAGMADVGIEVQVNNVLVSGVSTNYKYVVTAIDPGFLDPPTFTDSSLHTQSTSVRAVHITELRQAINDLRARYSLAPFAFTDAALTAGRTVIKAAHINELRTALAAVYTAAGRAGPTYTRSPITARLTIVGGADVAELRAAVLNIW